MKWSIHMIVAIGAAALGCVAPAVGRSPSDAAPVGADEVAVYEAVLTSWLGDERGRQLIDRRLSAPPSRTDGEFAACAKGLDFPEATTGTKSLDGVRFKRDGIELIDGAAWTPADPSAAIASGKSVDAAVKDGFAASLISFSQIAFTRDGRDALVKFSMVCGGLCGSGSTFRLHRRGAAWAVADRCGGWVS